jgi:acyl-CoA thioester hydrolase
MIEFYHHPHTVAQSEIDEQGHANNVCFVSWMQEAAVAHSASLGWTADRYRQLGTGWVARSHTIEYLRPALAGDEITIETRVADMKKATSVRVYRIVRRADGELLAKAETNWAFVNYATGRPTRILREIVEAFQTAKEAPRLTCGLVQSKIILESE